MGVEQAHVIDPLGSCDREGCTAPGGAGCLEGHEEPAACPHFTTTARAVVVEEAKKNSESDRVPLYTGFELDSEGASLIARDAPTRVVVLAGPQGSGKTTLIATLYDRFQEGPFAGYLFAGSYTLPAFERICHHSRIASERAIPETERTPQAEKRRFLHLRLRSPSEILLAQDILFLDLAGEFFRLVRDSEEECKNFLVLKRADHFALLVDGEELANLTTRARVLHDGRRLLRSCLDAGMLGRETLVQVLYSKWDLIAAHSEHDAITETLKAVEDELLAAFLTRVGALNFSKVAARPQNESVPPAFGLDELLRTWVRESLLLESVDNVGTEDWQLRNEFDRYSRRHFRSLGGSPASL